MNDPSADAAGVDMLALDEETAERLLAGDLHPAQAPPGYAKVAALLATAAAAPSPDELAGQAATLGDLEAVARAQPAVVSRRADGPGRRRRLGFASLLGGGSARVEHRE